MKPADCPVTDCPAVPVVSSDAPARSLAHLLWGAAGFASFGLGALGAVLPVLPTTPFLLLAAFCFARSSRRLNDWFLSTRLYKNNLESFVRGRGMTRAAKLRIMGIVTLTMAFGFAMMGRVPAGRAVLAVVWVCHILYFIFGIRTIAPEETAVSLDAARTKEDEAA